MHGSFKTEQDLIDEQDDFIENPFEIEEGVIECRCGSKRVFSFSKQTRSADEPMTTYAECVQCGSKWTYSG
jgi:DNA-directed RNA polymerase subunit M/transcription elongation factor TFIIS